MATGPLCCKTAVICSDQMRKELWHLLHVALLLLNDPNTSATAQVRTLSPFFRKQVRL